MLGAREPTLLIALSCYGTTRADYRALISSALSSFPFFYFFWFGHSEGRGMSTCQSDHSAAKNPEFMAHGYEDGRSSFVPRRLGLRWLRPKVVSADLLEEKNMVLAEKIS